jgi:hypothetical protein
LITYAINNNWNPIVIATIQEFPEMLASFEDYEKPEQNMYINDPRDVRMAVVTPRSLEASSDVINDTMILGNDIMCHALKGTVGEKAMHNMLTMVTLDTQLTSWDDLIKAPTTAVVPTSAAAACVTGRGAAFPPAPGMASARRVRTAWRACAWARSPTAAGARPAPSARLGCA